MNIKNIKLLQQDIGVALDEARSNLERIEFLERILRQAILTAGGRLPVDPKLAERAKAERRFIMPMGDALELVG